MSSYWGPPEGDPKLWPIIAFFLTLFVAAMLLGGGIVYGTMH